MNFLDILDDKNISYLYEGNKHCRPGWIQLDCPYCGRASGKYHMGYNLSKNYVNCYRCGAHRLDDTVMELLDVSLRDAKNLLRDLDNVRDTKEETRTHKLVIPKGVDALQRAHLRYLERRGLNAREVAQTWELQGIGISARLPWRIFIPIKLGNKVVSWTTRSINSDANLRYISAGFEEEEVPHKTLLYGEHLARYTGIIVEGPGDAWNVGEGALATCGTSYTREQILRMSRFLRRIICFDNEAAAQRRARALAEELSAFPGETEIVQLDADDPGSASKKEIALLRKHAGL